MSIASDTLRKAGPFNGNGATTAFPFTFKIFAQADVLVVLTDASGKQTTQTLTSQYTVALNANQDSTPGGTVTMVTAPPTGYTLTVGSQMANTQTMVLTNAGGFFPTVLNNMADSVVIMIQQLLEKVNRSFSLPFSAPTNISAQVPLPTANMGLKWNSSGTGLTNSTYDPDTAGTAATAAAASASAASSSASSASSSASSASASASAAAASAAALPNVSGGANTVPVVNGSANGWLYKTAAQMLAFIGAAASGAATASGLTQSTARLLGRTTASTGAIEEISVVGATLSAGVLTINSAAIFDKQTFSSGSGTWTKPAGTSANSFARITLIASGSSGSSRTTTGNTAGGSSQAVQVIVPTSALSATESYAVGAATTGVTGNSNGNQGNQSTFTIGGLTLSSGRPYAPDNQATGVASSQAGVAYIYPSFNGFSIGPCIIGAGGYCDATNVPLTNSFQGQYTNFAPGGGGGCSSASGGTRTGQSGIGAGNGGSGGAYTGGNGSNGTAPGGGGGGAVQGGTSGAGAAGQIIVEIFN